MEKKKFNLDWKKIYIEDYITNHLCLEKIARKYKCSISLIQLSFKKLKLQRRKVGCINTGKTFLYRKIRHLKEFSIWRNSILERDNYTCRECGKKTVTLKPTTL